MASGLQPDLDLLSYFLQSQQLDFLALQEVDEETQRFYRRTTEVIGQKLAFNHYFSESMPFLKGSYGISLLSKWQIRDPMTQFFSISGDEPRLFQSVRLVCEKRQILMMNTHLSYENPDIRVAQVKEMNEFISRAKLPLIVAGDFNTDQDIAEWEGFSLDLNKVNGWADDWVATFMGQDANMRTMAIDNILFSSEFKLNKRQIIPTDLSDHALLIAEFDCD